MTLRGIYTMFTPSRYRAALDLQGGGLAWLGYFEETFSYRDAAKAHALAPGDKIYSKALAAAVAYMGA